MYVCMYLFHLFYCWVIFHLLYISQFVIHSPTDKYLGYLQFRSIVNEAAKDIYVLFKKMYPIISLALNPRVYFLG